MISGNEVIKHIRWGIDNLIKYRNSEFYEITPSFILSELFSKSNRIHHYEEYERLEEQKKFEFFTEEEKTDIIAAREFAQSQLSGTPDLKRFPLMDYAMSLVALNGIWAEFGVFKGESINHIARNTMAKVHGFDSFSGLPEDWNRFHSRGHFKVGQNLPYVADNVSLHVGLFSGTLPDFRAQIGDTPVAFLHVDCDLYSSTVEIFRYLGENIVPGTVILFDEFYNYPGWMMHEYKAFQEFISATGKNYRYIGYNKKAEQVAVMMQ